MSTSALPRLRRSQGAVRRAPGWVRVFALLLALLAASGQQRTSTPEVRALAPVARAVAASAQHIQTDALRAGPALRVAAAPSFLPQPPLLPIAVWSSRWASSGFAIPSALGAPPVYRALGHFHGQRRIPRMNSEEPPRA